ncbi:MAG: thermonuclease family protein [Novosphingobium sp.]
MRIPGLSWRSVLLVVALPSALVAAGPVHATPPDAEHARFALCGSGPRVTCVVDGDTFWYQGTKVRIADINTPETARPSCRTEAELGERARLRLLELLNSGAFTLEVRGRETDRYGRALRIVTRGGRSLAETLVAEGLAEAWTGRRGNWCTAAGA